MASGAVHLIGNFAPKSKKNHSCLTMCFYNEGVGMPESSVLFYYILMLNELYT